VLSPLADYTEVNIKLESCLLNLEERNWQEKEIWRKWQENAGER
jgi:hypothetical protein